MSNCGQFPEYLCNKLVLVSETSVRSSRYGHIALRCPKYNRKTKGGKKFLTSSVLLWNSLPGNIRSSERINAFKRKYIKFVKEGYATSLDIFNFFSFLFLLSLNKVIIIIIIIIIIIL